MQTRQKGQICFVLTLSPRLYTFITKEYLTADSTPITATGSELHVHVHTRYSNCFVVLEFVSKPFETKYSVHLHFV